MLREFREFLNRGSAFDLAVGVVIGAAFNKIVNSFVADVLTPIIGILMGGINFKGQAFQVGGSIVTYGNFIQAIIDFLLTALVLFLLVKLYNAFRRKEDKKKTTVLDTKEIVLLTQIRDLLGETAASAKAGEPKAAVEPPAPGAARPAER